MAKKIRFPLKMKNGAEVRTLDELKENFDLESVLSYFTDGKLTTWLADRYYDEKAEAVSALSADTPDLNAKLCNILEVEYQGDDDVADLEYIQRRNEKLRILSAYTDNKDILNNIDIVALSQDELFDILDEQPEKVYLYGEKFSIPFGAKNVCYVGVNNPLIILETDKSIDKYEEANIKFQKVSFEGNVNPFITTGEKLYLEGKYHEAFPIIEQAANNGNPRAMYIMARYYQDGYEVVKINKEKRNSWCERAYPYKEPLSMYGYAAWCLKDGSDEQKNIYALIFTDVKLLAESGDSFAQGTLGCMYDEGYGIAQDKSLAVKCMIEAANQGYPYAQNYLGWMYKTGNGIDKDIVKALEWYRKAAEQGFACAQCNLGIMYENGNGVDKDYGLAEEWYIKAAEQDYIDAIKNLAFMYNRVSDLDSYDRQAIKQTVGRYHGKLCNIDLDYDYSKDTYRPRYFDYRKFSVEYTFWLCRGAELGDPYCKLEAGYRICEYGHNNEFSEKIKMAIGWLEESTSYNSQRAYNVLGHAYEFGVSIGNDYIIEKNISKAIDCYRKAGNQNRVNYLTKPPKRSFLGGLFG